jgi:hypothetical protein
MSPQQTTPGRPSVFEDLIRAQALLRFSARIALRKSIAGNTILTRSDVHACRAVVSIQLFNSELSPESEQHSSERLFSRVLISFVFSSSV